MAERPTGTPCWVDISVPDVEAAKAFYAELLGWECRTDPRPEAGGYTMCFVDGVVAGCDHADVGRGREGRLVGLSRLRRRRL